MEKLPTEKINTTKLTARKAQDELITSCSVTKYRRACKNDGDLSRGHRSQLEGASTGQICDHRSNKLRKIINYKPTGGKGIHESVSITEEGRGWDLAYEAANYQKVNVREARVRKPSQ